MNQSFDKSKPLLLDVGSNFEGSSAVHHNGLLEGLVKQGDPSGFQAEDGFGINNQESEISSLSQPIHQKSLEGTFSLQFKAILKKNMTLQAKHTCTNICQVNIYLNELANWF